MPPLQLDILDPEPSWLVSPQIRGAVQRRDFWTCRFCGVRSLRYQQVIAITGNWHDVDRMLTVCPLCQPCCSLELAVSMQSGVLIEWPSLDQAELNRVVGEIHVAKVLGGTAQNRRWQARALASLDLLNSARAGPRTRLGTDDPGAFAARLRECGTSEARGRFRDNCGAIRLLCLGKRTIADNDLVFNQWPQIIAYWRSPDGPFPATQPDRLVHLQRFAERYVDPAAMLTYENRSKPRHTHASMAAQFLRDASGFFERMPAQGADSSMHENARIFGRMAQLLEKEPMGAQGEIRYAKVGADMLRNAARLYRSVGKVNEPIREQLNESADIYARLADLLETDPGGLMD
jgi:intracellular multiplication protein IcmJ